MPSARMHDRKKATEANSALGLGWLAPKKTEASETETQTVAGEILRPCPTKMQLKPGRNKLDPHPSSR